MTTYINIKSSFGLETIDEFETRKEAFKMLKEYRMSYPAGYNLYLSSRCCNDWRNK